MKAGVAALLTAAILAAHGSAGDVRWSGQVVVSDVVTIERPDNLVIEPGAQVRFTGPGRLECKDNILTAEGAAFSADAPLNAAPRIRLSGGVGRIEGCSFSGLATTDHRWHDASVVFHASKMTFARNAVTGVSAVEFAHCEEGEIEGNLFNGGGEALVLFHTRHASVRANTFRQCHISVKLNEASHCLIENNRSLDARSIGVLLYGKSRDNRLIGNSVFSGAYGLVVRGGGARNTLVSNLMEGCVCGLRLWDAGPDNKLLNSVFHKAGMGVEVKSMGKGATFLIQNSAFAECGATASAAADGLVLRNNLVWNGRKHVVVREGCAVVESDTIKSDPGFVNAAESDYRPADGSPLLKAGAPPGTNIGLFP